MIISYLGCGCLYVATICSAIALLRSRWQVLFVSTFSLAILLAFGLLLCGFMLSDMSIKNVFLNSSSILPLTYKISASWASHEGSLLLWLSLFAIVNYLYIINFFLINKEYVSGLSLYSSIYALCVLLFLITVIYTSNPFESFAFEPKAGLGLNPMLQDVALAIHPPVLYLGNICFAPIFISSLVVMRYPGLMNQVFCFNKKLLNIALSLLTLGIGLGAWWAYRELGWGGYWFFDPVENISLMPWLSGIALYHFLLVYKKDKTQNIITIICLSISTFLLVLYGTFIVRSGIISSVHAFAFSPERGVFLFAICLVLTILPFYYFCNNQIKCVSKETNLQMKLISCGSFLFLLSLLVIIISLMYPIYCYFVNKVEVTIDIEYFYTIFVPIFIPVLFLSAIAPFCIKSINFLKVTVTVLFSGLVTFYLFDYSSGFSIKLFLLCCGGIFLCTYILLHIYCQLVYHKRPITNKQFAMFLSHFGFGMLVISIVLNVLYSQKIDFIGKVGREVISGNKLIRLLDIKLSSNENYYRQIASFQIEHDNNVVILKPENRLYKIENSLSQEVDIYSYLFCDVYAVISRIKDETVSATIYFQPFISFIWTSIFLMCLGFFIPILRLL